MTTLEERALAARNKLKYDTPLGPNDQLVVPDLNKARGSYDDAALFWALGIEGQLPVSQSLPHYVLFGGHRGCGKSTELRRLQAQLHRNDRYFVILVDALEELDITNVSYSDVLLALAKVLFKTFDENSIPLEQVFLTRIVNWFDERIEKTEKLRELAGEIKTELKGKTGIPFLAEMFASLTNTARYNSSHKEEVRTIVRNSFSQLVDAFNTLLTHAEEQLQRYQKGQKLLFIVDGTDRLYGDNTSRFFISEVHNLKRVQANFIYCAPIDLLTETSMMQTFDEIIRLPMIKVGEKQQNSTALIPEQLRQLVKLRVDEQLFDHADTIDYIIRHSGGHLRDLIRLLNYCLAKRQTGQTINCQLADQAIAQLATEYRRLIQQDDYRLLAEIDLADKDHTPNNEQTRRLLYDLILLEYNSYWWQSHPVVQTLSGYKKALAELDEK